MWGLYIIILGLHATGRMRASYADESTICRQTHLHTTATDIEQETAASALQAARLAILPVTLNHKCGLKNNGVQSGQIASKRLQAKDKLLETCTHLQYMPQQQHTR